MEIMNVFLLSVLFAISMKIAHEIGDGRLKLFRGSGLFFGILWGVLAGNLIMYDKPLANIWMAILAGWILRSKINNFYIAIGTTIMFLTFILDIDQFMFYKEMFLLFFIVMTVSGLSHDYLYKNEMMSRKNSELINSIISYTILPLFYSSYTGNWLIFLSLFTFMITYELTRKYAYLLDDIKFNKKSKTKKRRVVKRIA